MLEKFRQGVFAKTVSGIIAFLVAWTPIRTTVFSTEQIVKAFVSLSAMTAPSMMWADEFTDAAGEGSSFGQDLTDGYSGMEDSGSGQISFPDSGVEINPNQLYPDDTTGDSQSDLESVYGSDEDMIEMGGDAQMRLDTEDSETGEAYRITNQTAKQPRPDLESDPVWGQTDEVYENIDTISEDFADCSTDTITEINERTGRVSEYETCERVTTLTEECEFDHKYAADQVVQHVDGPMNVQSCGEGCVDIWIGKVGDNYWSGYCDIFEQGLTVDIAHPEAITSAKLTYAKWDDYILVTLNDDAVYAGPYGGDRLKINEIDSMGYTYEVVEYAEGETGACELSTSWEKNPNKDLTSYFQEGGELDFNIKTEVAGGGEGYAKIRIHYDTKSLISQDEWTPKPDSCGETLQAIEDGACINSSVTCTDMPSTTQVGDSLCTTVNGIQVCDSDLKEPPAPVNALCREVTVSGECSFNQGQLDCYTDIYGEEQCPENDGSQPNTCTELENDPDCGFVKSTCIDGAEGDDGDCYVTEETWDCGYDVDLSQETEKTVYDCDGTIRCMGEECIDPRDENNEDFARAASTLQAANQMRMDTECTGKDTTENVVCEIFRGEEYECKKAVGGISDCCDKPKNVSLGDYLKLVSSMDSLMGTSMMEGNIVSGSWNKLSNMAGNAGSATWEAVQGNFSSSWDTLTGTADSAAGSGIKQEMMNQTAEWVTDTFGEAVTDTLFEQTASGSYQLGGAVGTALSWMMYAYMIYVLVTLIIQIIWECEDDELELGAKRALKSCHHVGSYCKSDSIFGCIEKRESYCCFNSPLGRIIHEEARPQFGEDWGTPRNPQCDGFTFDQFEKIDWDKVNLDEWIAILKSTGNWPGDNIDMENITGEGNKFNTGDRLETGTRTEKRMDGIDTGDAENDAEQYLRGTVP